MYSLKNENRQINYDDGDSFLFLSKNECSGIHGNTENIDYSNVKNITKTINHILQGQSGYNDQKQ